MTVAAVPDAEFIELFKHHQSPSIVAKVLGINARAVNNRRNRIELKYNIQLKTADHTLRNTHVSPVQHAAVQQLRITDGQVVVFSDAHFWPGIRTTAFKGLLHFVKALRPVAIVCNGDAFDGAAISRFPRIGWDRTPSVIQELKACKAALGEVEEMAGRAKLFWPLGNHDARFETRLANQASEFEGVTGFHLKDHLPAWSPCWRLDVNDDVVIKHRYKGGIHATRNNTLNTDTELIQGRLRNRWGRSSRTISRPGCRTGARALLS